MNDRFDCVVIGAGPAGSTAAALASQAGFRTLLVERDREPSAGPAEPLSPAALAILARLGIREARGLHFCRQGLLRRLWDAARNGGVSLLADARALKVLLVGDQAVGVRVELASGGWREVACAQVIDASGEDSLLTTQLAAKQTLGQCRQAVIWGTYQGVARQAHPAEQELFPAGSGAMFRLLPCGEDLACLALIGSAECLLEGRGTPEEIFEDELVLCPALAERLIAARLLERFFVGIRPAFSVSQASGPGWRIIGDARQPADLLAADALSQAILAGQQAAAALSPAARSAPAGRWFSVSATNSPC